MLSVLRWTGSLPNEEPSTKRSYRQCRPRDSPLWFPGRAGLETRQSRLLSDRARAHHDDEWAQLDLGRDTSSWPFIMHREDPQPWLHFESFSKEIESQTTRTQTTGFEGGLCLPSHLIDLNAVIGLTWFLPNQHITSLRTQSPRGPMMVFFEDRLDRLAIVSSIALGEHDVWGVGLGVEHLATTVGKIQLSGELLLDETEQPNLEGTIDFLFESKRRLLASAWMKLPSYWGIA